MSLCEQSAPSPGLSAHSCLLPCYYFPFAKQEIGPERHSDSPRVTQLGSKNLHVWAPEPSQGPAAYVKSLI